MSYKAEPELRQRADQQRFAHLTVAEAHADRLHEDSVSMQLSRIGQDQLPVCVLRAVSAPKRSIFILPGPHR